MHLFTWNLNKRAEMASLAVAHLERLAKDDHVIATLQEWPVTRAYPQGTNLRVVPAGEKALLLYSSSLTLLKEHGPDASGRATVARFSLPDKSEIGAVGLHWYSRDSRAGIEDPSERGGAMALFRHHLAAQLNTPAVIMGDFNASPSHREREIYGKYCLFARDQRHRSTPASETVMGHNKPAWVLVEPKKPKDVGTYFWKNDQAWHDFDHVILTPDLKRHLNRAEILTTLDGHEFLTPGKRVPRGAKHASDHLPVVCEIHFQ